MKAVVLAGGFGTRLQPLTYYSPKPTIPLLNRPAIEYIIEYLRDHGISEILVTTNYMREQVMGYLGDGSKYGIEITYPVEEKAMGTAGSVKNIARLLDDTFVVMQGDIITDIDLRELIETHERSGAAATIALTDVANPSQYGVVETGKENRVVGFQEKPSPGEEKTNRINSGLYVIEPSALEFIPEDEKYDFSRDLFPKLVEKQVLYAKAMDGFWSDIGNLEGYRRAKKWLMGRIQSCIPKTACIDGVMTNPVVFGHNVKVGKDARIVGPAVIGDNTVIEDGCFIGPGTVLGPNVTIKNGTQLYDTIVFSGTVVGRGGRLESCLVAEDGVVGGGVIVDPNSVIGAGCKLGWNVKINEDAMIWPNMFVSHGAIVSGTLRQFVQREQGVDNPYWHLRRLSDDESFYFNKSVNDHIIHTGFKANSLPQFREQLERVDLECIKHHLRYDLNDFREWADKIICDSKLAGDFEDLKRDSMWWTDQMLKNKIAGITDDRLRELYELVYY